jgi:Sec-independent protein translocase protein TatA
MGIGDWFKRFKKNAAGFEEYREGTEQEDGADQSQAARAAHEGVRPSEEGASASDENSAGTA